MGEISWLPSLSSCPLNLCQCLLLPELCRDAALQGQAHGIRHRAEKGGEHTRVGMENGSSSLRRSTPAALSMAPSHPGFLCFSLLFSLFGSFLSCSFCIFKSGSHKYLLHGAVMTETTDQPTESPWHGGDPPFISFVLVGP